MEHATQLRILDELLDMLERGASADAGVLSSNPTAVYTDADLARREWQTLFREHPQIVALSGDLPSPGSYFSVDDFGLPLLVTRDDSGRVRAFVNACRHRGARLVEAERGNATRFSCPFHGWNYRNDGVLLGVTEAAQFGAIDKRCHALLELPAAEHCGLVWVHPCEHGVLDPPGLLGALDAELASWHIGAHVYRGGRTFDMRMNWKLANDTFGETYHFKRLHRATLDQIFIGDALAYEVFARNHRAVFPGQAIRKLKDKPRSDWRIDRVATVIYFLFPNVQLIVSDRQVTLFRIYPGADASHSRTRVSHYFSAQALDLIASGTKTVIDDRNVYDATARDGNAIIAPEAAMEISNSTVEREDFRMAEATQLSAECGHLEHLVFGRNEAPLRHMHNAYRAALGMSALATLAEMPAASEKRHAR